MEPAGNGSGKAARRWVCIGNIVIPSAANGGINAVPERSVWSFRDISINDGGGLIELVVALDADGPTYADDGVVGSASEIDGTSRK